MGLYSGEKEEAAIREALAARKDIDEVIPDADDTLTLDPMAALFAKLTGTAGLGASHVQESCSLPPRRRVPVSWSAMLFNITFLPLL